MTTPEIDFEAWVHEHFRDQSEDSHAEIDAPGRMGRAVQLGEVCFHLTAFRVTSEDAQNPVPGSRYYDEIAWSFGQDAPFQTATFDGEPWVIFGCPGT